VQISTGVCLLRGECAAKQWWVMLIHSVIIGVDVSVYYLQLNQQIQMFHGRDKSYIGG